MASLIHKALAAVAFAGVIGCVTPALAQDTFELTFDQARNVAREAVTNGNSAIALELADTLLEANPEDADAWLIRAGALLQLGNPTEARRAAASAYRYAPSMIRKYEAARVAALAASNEDRLTLAQWWLRRALTQSPSPEATAQTRQDAVLVGRRNPWQTSLEFSLAPSDNVNGGTSRETYQINGEGVEFAGLEFQYNSPLLGQALSGWRGNFGLSTRYILSQTPTERHSLTASFITQQIRLSDDSKDLLAGADINVSSNYFDYSRLTLGYSHDTLNDLGLMRFDVGAFGVWQGGPQTSEGIRASASLSRQIHEGGLVTASMSSERRWTLGGDYLDHRRSVDLRYQLTAGDAGTFGATFAYSELHSGTATSENDTWLLSASYAPSNRIGPAQLYGQIGYSWSDYDVYRDFINVEGFATPILADVPGGRQDERVFGRIIAAFPDVSYAGFFPVVTMNAGRTTSNVSRFDREDFAVDLSFRSSF